ncbi:hypothetical protein GIB67_026189 [Kingdonia uniflora]|uniref:RING-type domain-containing protein n=1 Tax=Kingdonia uniflora TaxID=39325 RepID=A0A7J7LSH6_9MAGN|nr:hypothetical protein GIB67_026189 [Kingdonia uniflora]
MAVQASNLYRVTSNLLDGEGDMFGVYNNNQHYYYGGSQQQQFVNGTVISEQESELTCNASGSRKRCRDDDTHNLTITSQQQQQQQQLFLLQQQQQQQQRLQQQQQQQISRQLENRFTSTSGRTTTQDLNTYAHHHNLELDALIHLQNEKLRFTVEESRKRHCRVLQSLVQQKVVKKLAEKDFELETARRRNAELEEKVKQISAENQLWFNVAKNNEGLVSSLRTTLQQILTQQQQQQQQTVEEGYGDSDCIEIVGDDVQSCCYDTNIVVVGEEQRSNNKKRSSSSSSSSSMLCKVCNENDVSVLLLPCRHLCLCKHCESKHDTCPICQTVKNASLQIFI